MEHELKQFPGSLPEPPRPTPRKPSRYCSKIRSSLERPASHPTACRERWCKRTSLTMKVQDHLVLSRGGSVRNGSRSARQPKFASVIERNRRLIARIYPKREPYRSAVLSPPNEKHLRRRLALAPAANCV